MNRFMLILSYVGTNYCGWQIQNNALSVQRVVIDTLESVVGKLYDGLHGCSRTDSGVHADCFVCHFDSETKIPPENIVKALNSRLPDDISCLDCKIANQDFHARYSVKSKTYRYVINNSHIPNPFTNRHELLYNRKINVDLLNSVAKEFIGYHDFSAFCASGSSIEDKRRNIYSCDVFIENGRVVFEICGDGFLYNMVRIIVGTLLSVNEGEISPESIKDIINSKDRKNAGYTVSAIGLHLHNVNY